MFALLSPRLWIAAALVAALAFSHFAAYRKGKSDVRAEWAAAVAAANQEARKLEQSRQRRADEAAQLAAAREARLRTDAAHAADSLRGLRDDLNTARLFAAQSRAAAEQTAFLATELLDRCSARYIGVAEAAQRADTEARELRQGWPK